MILKLRLGVQGKAAASLAVDAVPAAANDRASVAVGGSEVAEDSGEAIIGEICGEVMIDRVS